jgi:uncharacterized iron-regulated protein
MAAALLAAMALPGCSAQRAIPPAVGAASPAHGAVTEPAEDALGRHFVVDLHRPPRVQDIVPRLVEARVVVGETHTRYDHHLAQLAIIEALHRRDPDLAIGLELFQQPFQQALDDFVAGRVDEAGLLRRTEYFERWGFDYRLYRPILRYARAHGIPLVALNVPKEVTRKVGEVGLAGLDSEERAALPAEITPAGDAYRARLRAVFEQHKGKAEGDFERFLEVQQSWDEGMAARAAEYLAEYPGQRMVVLAGSGHVAYRDAIPDRLARRLGAATLSVVPGDAVADLDPESADFALFTEEQALPPQGLLGVMLDTSEGGVRVLDFAHDSPAREQGMRKGDRIVALGDTPIADLADLKVHLLGKAPGEAVRVGVSREGEGRLEYRVVLR